MDAKQVVLALALALAACSGEGDGSAPPAPAGATIRVSWVKPERNVDGTLLTDIASYRVRYGASETTLDKVVTVPGSQLSATIRVLPGRYYLTVQTVNSTGEVSAPTPVVFDDAR